MLIKDLGGHSGCKIFLFEDNNVYYVKKISSSPDYNSRLMAQCDKQEHFKSSSVKTPKILNKGFNEDGLFYYDMEYIQGVTLAKYITKIDVSEINGIASTIIKNIDFSIKGNNNTSVFFDKINDIKSKIFVKQNDLFDDAFSFLSNYDWSDFSSSYCHGDLTLENIIVKNGDMYYIDFLDSFYDCWILDIGKLLQDTECMWSYRNQVCFDVNTKIRLIILKEIIIKKLRVINPKYIEDSYVALLLNLLRIYPYVHDDETYEFLNNQVGRVLNILKEGRMWLR